jgi:serine/threonine protein kinase/dienelactone hydrolase
VTPERWQEVKKVLAGALERAPAERHAYLDQACTDVYLRHEVESLIAAHEQGESSFMGQPVLGRGPLESGTKLGPYKVLAPLGAGGMGVVYRARDERLERDVAIKVLSPGLLIDEAARRRFRKEALALAKLNHPNIAAVYDVGQQEAVDYLVMEYVPGHSLAETLKSARLPAKEALALGEEVARALQEAHEQGVVHRDLKPANIIVTPKGHAKVLDFGLAKLLSPADSGDLTLSFVETRGPVGTPAYMSPEQAEGKIVDSRTDLWSLGAVLYESLSGRTPFHGAGSLQLLRAITQETPKPLRELRPDVSNEAEHIISHALEKDASLRYQSASEMARDLSDVLTQMSATAQQPAGRELKVSLAYALPTALLVTLLAVSGGWFYHRSERRHWAREEAIPEIATLKAADKSLAAFLQLKEAQRYLPADSQLSQIAAEDTRVVSVTSSPPGAKVAIQDYLSPNSAWYPLGSTPLKNVRIPTGYLRWKVLKPGLTEYVAAPITREEMNFSLDSARAGPEGMVWVGADRWIEMIDFVGWVGPYNLPSFYIDRFEVTNRQYQEFVDKGGYQKREYWKQKFLHNGRELSWNEAMALFRDSSGRAGPSTWEAGHYPEGQADYPVSGVSWYEASAYAAFVGKSLPALAQWFEAAPPEVARYTVQESNISRSGVSPVGSFNGLGPYGTYDMAGNVREWTASTTSEDAYFILGGAWKSQTYQYIDPEALSPFDRSPTNGFRCVRNTTPLPPELARPVKTLERDFAKAKPASDEVFRAYQAMYSYDKTPLNAKVEGVVQDSGDWREEKITFDAAYNRERMAAYLFLPKKVNPPFQTVVFFPSARVLNIPSSDNLGDIKFFDYIVQSGRAVLYPIYQNTYERRVKLVRPGASQAMELTVQRFKDLGRSLDYLQTRADIDQDKLAYLGVSMGSAEGIIYATLLQDRLKAVVFLDGGFFLGQPRPGRDQVDFAPRLKKPVLMVNGRYDFTFSLEKAQNPLFRMLGTPETEKRHIVRETPHDVTEQRAELVKDVLGWLDKYLGRVDQ